MRLNSKILPPDNRDYNGGTLPDLVVHGQSASLKIKIITVTTEINKEELYLEIH